MKSIDLITNQHDYDEYYNRCIDLIFPVSMYFRENKRLKDQREKQTLKDFKRDIFDESIPIERTVKKYFKLVKELMTTYNIAYRNTTCASVSKTVRETLLKKKVPYEVGEVLVCRTWFKMKKVVFQVNYEYAITGVAGNNIKLDNGMEVPVEIVKKNFIFNYARTAHSFHGSSIDDAITIYDWRFTHVDRRWIYTAVTRATDLKKVYFNDYDEKAENIEKMLQYFQKKVDNYKYQDKRANREIDGRKYINKEWLLGCIGTSCGSCGDCLTYSRAGCKIDCNLTAQRIDCKVGHQLDNVVPFCTWCNMALSNREE